MAWHHQPSPNLDCSSVASPSSLSCALPGHPGAVADHGRRPGDLPFGVDARVMGPDHAPVAVARARTDPTRLQRFTLPAFAELRRVHRGGHRGGVYCCGTAWPHGIWPRRWAPSSVCSLRFFVVAGRGEAAPLRVLLNPSVTPAFAGPSPISVLVGMGAGTPRN